MSVEKILATLFVGIIALFAPPVSQATTDQKIVAAISQEPRTLNTLTAESVSYTAQLLVHVNEGLMRYDARRRLAGGVAEHWNMTDESLTFWLREDAVWSNGEPVTANDFVFAWRQLVNPDTASPTANLAAPIKNAAKILAGELDSDQLGVVATGVRELTVSLEHPCGWCLKLFTNSIFYPVNQAFYQANEADYGTSARTHLSNGAFYIHEWQRGKKILLRKNASYWRASEVHATEIVFGYYGAESKTQLNLLRSSALSIATLDRDTLQSAMDLGYRIKTFPTGHLFHIQFSHVSDKLSANENLRKAIALVIDKDELVDRVVASPGTRVADSMFHDWLSVGDQPYISSRPPNKHRPDIKLAKTYMTKARQELSLPANPTLTLTISDSNLHRRVAEYLQSRLRQHLDIKLAIDPQITQILVKKWREGESDLVLTTWPVDVDDPMDQISFMGDPNFRRVFKGLYAGDDMASLYFRARNAVSVEDRLDAVSEVHTLFSDKVTVLPLFETYGAVVTDPAIRGYIWQPVRGYGDFRYVRFRN